VLRFLERALSLKSEHVNIELVINSTKKGLRIAMLEDGLLVELHEDNGDQDYAVGDIYVGKVRKVLPSLNAAFVDIGHGKDAFLHYLDLGPQYLSSKNYAARSIKGSQQTSNLGAFRLEKDIDKKGKIKDDAGSGRQGSDFDKRTPPHSGDYHCRTLSRIGPVFQ
jgi:ribonuclease G